MTSHAFVRHPHESAQPQIENLDNTGVVQKQIRGFDVAVDHPSVVRMRQTLRDLDHPVDNLIRGNDLTASEHLLEVFALEVFHDNIRRVFVLIGVKGADHVRVVKHTDDLHFAKEPGERIF